MASRIRPHWEDVKGNAKWDFIKYVWWLVAPFLTAIFTSAVAYVKNASMWQVIFLGIVVGLIVFGLIVLARYLFGQDNRPKGKAFLFSVGKDKGRAPNASKSYGDICWWYRVEITTDRPEGIKGCMGRLIKIRRGEKILFEKEEVILTFAPGENPDTTAKFIYPKTEFPLDLFYITQQNEIKVAIHKRYWRYLPPMLHIFTEPAVYLIDILVVGDGAEPSEAAIEFIWTGNWMTSELRVLAQS